MARKRRARKIKVTHADGRVQVVRPGHYRRGYTRKPKHWYLRTDHWRKIRQAALTRDGHRCTQCGAHGTTARLEVHHLTYERKGRELLSDVATLCRDCHGAEHEKRAKAAA